MAEARGHRVRHLLWLILFACGGEATEVALFDGIEGELGVSLESCESLSASAREWCAFDILSQTAPAGTQVLNICSLLSGAVRDRCIELSQRVEEPADARECDRIQDLQIQRSCRLHGAEGAAIQGDLTAGLRLCSQTGEMERFCHYHLVQGSVGRWRRGDGLAQLQIELETLISQIPEPDAGLIPFIGRAAVNLGGRPSTDPVCEVFGSQPSLESECERFYREYYVAGPDRRRELQHGAQPSWPN
jgi:hypothetical protein